MTTLVSVQFIKEHLTIFYLQKAKVLLKLFFFNYYQEDMDKQGVKTTQKGVCAACKKPIVGQVINV